MKKRLYLFVAMGLTISMLTGIPVSATERLSQEASAVDEDVTLSLEQTEMVTDPMEGTGTEGTGTEGSGETGEPGEIVDPDEGKEFPVLSDGWHYLDGNWYWYVEGKPVSGWKLINKKWYYMDSETFVMQTGFFRDNSGTLYHCNESGAMTGGGWHQISGKWYYMNRSGEVAAAKWIRPDGRTWYYMNEDGSMATGWKKVGGTWYYMNKSGAMQIGWLQYNNKRYYLEKDGSMVTGWKKFGSDWYYFDASGAMKTGWVKVGSTWYYMNNNGVMAANKWIGNYYVNKSGAMVTNDWVGPYYVGSDGKWIPNYDPVINGGKWEKVDGNWYFKCQDGSYLKNRWQKMDGKWYYFGSDGVMAVGWKYIGGYKYYFDKSGELVQDVSGIIGKQSSYYITVNRAKCQVMIYAAEGGKYNIPVKTFTCSVGLSYTPTPTGTYRTQNKFRWLTLVGPSYGQYCTQISGDYLFHSVPGSNMTSYSISAAEYNKLGSPASHGCIRLTARDAKWIYDNCKVGTTVSISDNAYTPFDKPILAKIPAGQTWDPTDPNL